MVQTGAIIAAGVSGLEDGDPVSKAMAAVEMAATITIKDLRAADVSPAAAAFALIEWHCRGAAKPDWLDV